MNEILMEFSNKEFYEGKLKTDESVKNITFKDFKIKIPKFGNFWDKILDPEECHLLFGYFKIGKKIRKN
jgi:superfamily I DNA and/or RNA helicase